MGELPELVVVDDPLEPRRPTGAEAPEVAPQGPPAAPRQAPARAPRSTSGPIRVVAARVPVELADRLEGAALELRRRGLGKVAQQELLAALLARYVDDRAEDSLDGLEELVRAYRAGSSELG